MEERKKVIIEFLDALKKLHESGWAENLSISNAENFDKITKIFNKEYARLDYMILDYPKAIGNRYGLLFDNKNVNKIVNTLSQDEYFNNLFS